MNIFIHYFKTRALRQIVQWLFVAVISIMVIGAFAVADAYAQGSYLCSDLTGASGGTCNIDAGCMDFDTTPPSSSFAAQVCGPTIAVVGGVAQDLELHGWVWDTNLGYISLYCDTTGKNNGVDCGSIPYGVKVNAATGDMSGWAWSDNMGWISFSCQGGSNQGYACGGINYKTSMNLKVNKDLGKITGYAWADTVGWFNFQTGDVHAKILDLIMRKGTSETNWGVWTKAEVQDDTLTKEDKNAVPTKSRMPVANSGEGYDIFVNVADIAGNSIAGTELGINLEIETLWEDTVGRNQVSGAAVDKSLTNDASVIKPNVQQDLGIKLVFKSKDTTAGVPYAHHGVVRSSMPTDGGNCYDGDGDGSCYGGEGDFFYKDFREEEAPSNSVKYLGAKVTLTVTDTGETWTTSPPLTPLNYPSGWVMDFLPQIDIPTFDYLLIPGDLTSSKPVIQAIRNKADEFNVEGKLNVLSMGSAVVSLVLESGDPEVNYVFLDRLADEDDPASKPNTKIFNKDNFSDLTGSLYTLPYAPDSALMKSVPGASIKSIVMLDPMDLSATSPRHYSNGLPRLLDSAVQTQAAQIISGGVFSPGSTEVVQGSDVPLFGDVAVYELRTQILSDVSSLIRGVNLPQSGLSSVEISSGGNDISGNAFKENRLYYFKDQDVTIEDISVLSNGAPGKPVTVVVDGGDLYINDNIDKNQSFGFIVFESDDAVDGAFTTKGGRIYVHSDVTDMVNVHIFADGPVFRYADDVCYFWGNYGPGLALVGLREPNFVSAGRCSSATGSFKEPLSVLTNQFYLKGNIASFNCLGCSTNLSPSRGDGLILGGPSALNFAIARLYDFNYFAYFRQDPVSMAFSGNRSTNVMALEAAGKITNGDAAVYFEYVPAPTDLFGFRNF